MHFSYRFTWKFYVGIMLIIFSFILGKVTTVVLLIFFYDPVLRLLALLAYILSWPMLVLGAWWVGQEYYQEMKRYFSYRFYQQQVKEKTRSAVSKTKAMGAKMRERLYTKREVMMSRIRRRRRK